MKGCENCKEVYVTSTITSPDSFKKATRVVKSNLEDGTIIESDYWPKGKIKTCYTPFNEVTGEGVYTEDFYIYYFECPKCHQLYKLSCETYHGSGGEWKPVTDNNF